MNAAPSPRRNPPGGRPRPATPSTLETAKAWISERTWTDLAAEAVQDLTDEELIAGIEAHFIGGWAEFVRAVEAGPTGRSGQAPAQTGSDEILAMIEQELADLEEFSHDLYLETGEILVPRWAAIHVVQRYRASAGPR